MPLICSGYALRPRLPEFHAGSCQCSSLKSSNFTWSQLALQLSSTSQCLWHLWSIPKHAARGPSPPNCPQLPQPWPPLLWQLVQIASAGHLDMVEICRDMSRWRGMTWWHMVTYGDIWWHMVTSSPYGDIWWQKNKYDHDLNRDLLRVTSNASLKTRVSFVDSQYYTYIYYITILVNIE